MDSRQWSFSVLRAHGLQHIHKDKIWRPIVCVSVDCSAGRENHCPTYETVLGTDGQNPNQKEVFLLPNFPRPTSKLTISVHYRSTSKKKAKKRVLVASCTCSIGELVQLQRQEAKPQLRLTTHSNSFTKSSKSQKSPAIVKRSSSSASGSPNGNPTNRLGYAAVQVRLFHPPGLEADRDWRRFAKWSLDSQLETWSESESQSERGVFGAGEHEIVSSPTSSKASAWPPISPVSDEGDKFAPPLPNSPSSSSSRRHHDRDEVNTHHSTSNTLRRRRRRRKPNLTGYSLDDDCDEGEQYVSESCTCTDSESGRKDAHVEKGYQSATPSYHSQYARDDDDDEEEDYPSRSQPHHNHHHRQENSHRWYTEVIRITSTIVDFMPMLDPGILPTFRTRDGAVDVDLTDCKFDRGDEEEELESEDGIDTASVYSNETQPEQEPGHLRREENFNPRSEGSRSKLSLDSAGSGTLVGSSPRGSFRSFSSSGWLKDKERRKGDRKKVQDTAEAIGIKTWWEKLLCAFTLYAEMKKAGELYGLVERSGKDEGKDEEQVSEKGSVVLRDLETGQGYGVDEKEELRRKLEQEGGRRQFEEIFRRLQVEWKYVAGILVALAAVDIAVFAISSDSLIQVTNIALSSIAASSIFTGLGIVCDAWFLLRFLGCDVETCLSRSFDYYYQTHLFFSLNSRIPALCLFLSTISLLGFLAVTAFATFPIGSGIICFLVGLGLGLQFVVRGVEVVGRVIGRSLKWTGKGLMRIVAFPLNLVRWKAASANATTTTPAAVDTGRSDEASVNGQTMPPSRSKSRLKIPELLLNIGSRKQKVTEPAKGEESGGKNWRERYEKAKAKTKKTKKTKTQVKARAEEEARRKDLEKNRDLRAEMEFGSLTRV